MQMLDMYLKGCSYHEDTMYDTIYCPQTITVVDMRNEEQEFCAVGGDMMQQ